MSISAAHSAAARHNGAQSHGPVTDEGKARSARNARKHGLFGNIILHTSEESDAYNELLEAYIEEYKPATIQENRCVREMVNAEWRLNAVRTRMALLEITFANEAAPDSTPEQACATAFHRMASTGQTLSLALRYERHFQRQYEKAFHDLTEARRKSALDRQEIAKRTDQAMASALKAAVEAPLPPIAPKPILQNEPKPPSFNPTLRTQPPPTQ
ncbi:MAG: hypothetical protein JST93_14020 [Acidobacteria bacterium]|nr:hypothetical protein [Acidobacteriota bacterium]